MRTLKFRIAYQHEETGRITFRSIELGDTIPFVAERWYVIGKDQYTGLHDKNDAEIYKSDILLHDFLTGKRAYKVEIGEEHHEIDGIDCTYVGVHFIPMEGYYVNASTGTTTDYPQADELEIIGHVYDNPELLDTSQQR